MTDPGSGECEALEALEALKRSALDFELHLDELTDQLGPGQKGALEGMLASIEVHWDGSRESQTNACKWLLYMVRLRNARDLVDALEGGEAPEAEAEGQPGDLCAFCEHARWVHTGTRYGSRYACRGAAQHAASSERRCGLECVGFSEPGA